MFLKVTVVLCFQYHLKRPTPAIAFNHRGVLASRARRRTRCANKPCCRLNSAPQNVTIEVTPTFTCHYQGLMSAKKQPLITPSRSRKPLAVLIDIAHMVDPLLIKAGLLSPKSISFSQERMGIASPVIKSAASDAKNRHNCATSFGPGGRVNRGMSLP